jgi:hypothetical protein
MIQNARVRARAAGVPFTIVASDVIIPTNCPILGIPLFQALGRKGGADNSPSLDRVEPERGYVPGNILVISNRANRLKSDASIEELRSIASFYATFERGVRVTGASQ